MLSKIIKDSYDVIVVGSGPAGTMAAKHCAKLGLSTLVIEKRQEIGVPVRCGEGLTGHWLDAVGLEFHPSWAAQEINGAILVTPKGREFKIGSLHSGYVIDRRVFDKKLAIDAAKAGADFLVKSRVFDVIKEGDVVKGVRVETPERKIDIPSKIVIAADGVDSKTARYAGLNTVNNIEEVDSGYEYEMIDVKIENHYMIYLYLGLNIAPRGYVWIFPKSKDRANVGIGISGDHDKTAKEYLDKFIAENPEIFKGSKIIEVKGGCVPVGAPLKKPYGHGIMVIGDAAHMVNPIHGGGMGLSMEVALIAADHAKKAIDEGDVSEGRLGQFYDEWYEKRGQELIKILKVRNFFERMTDDDMEALADIVTPEILSNFSKGKQFSTFIKLLAKKPKLALLAAKTLR
jgi:digeranylgeranylglycerophospholipid reductase